MKPSFLFAVAIATVLITLCTSFNFAEERTPSKNNVVVRQNAHFYWFTVPADAYDGYNTVTYEIGRMEMVTGKFCDTDPTGGVLVARGYVLPIVPHVIWPSQFIFAH